MNIDKVASKTIAGIC